MNLGDVRLLITADAREALSALDSFSKSMVSLDYKMQRLSSSLGGFFNPLMGALTAGAAVVTAATTKLTNSVLNVGGAFELQMNIVAAKSSATAAELAVMTEEARNLGIEFPRSATEVAEAMKFIAAQGAGVKGVLEATRPITELSIVQQYDLADSARLVAQSIRNFGLEWSEASRVGDVFNYVANNSAMTMEQFSDGLHYVAPFARDVNLTLEETAVIFGMLSDQGLRGAKGMVAFRGVIVMLMQAANHANSTAAKLFRDLGVELRDADGQLRAVKDILMDLSKTAMTAEQSFLMFGRRPFTAASALHRVFGELDDKLNDLAINSGSVQRNLELMLSSYEMLAKRVTGAVDELLHVGFDQIAVIAKTVATQLRELILAFADWADRVNLFGRTLGMLFTEFSMLLPTVDEFKATLNSIDVDMLVGRFNEIIAGVKRFATAMLDFAMSIPWDFISDHLETIARIITVGWAVGKFAGAATAVLGLAGAYIVLSKILTSLGTTISRVVTSWTMQYRVQNMAHAAAMKYYLLTGQLTKALSFKVTVLGFVANGLKALAISTALFLGKLALIATAIWIVYKAWNAVADWWNGTSSEGLEEQIDILDLYSKALDGCAESLEKLPKVYQEMVAEEKASREEKKKLQQAVEELDDAFRGIIDENIVMTKQILSSSATVEQQVLSLARVWGDTIKSVFMLKGREGIESFLSYFYKLPEDMQFVLHQTTEYVMQELGGLDQALANRDAPTETFVEKVRNSVQRASDEILSFARETTVALDQLVGNGMLSVAQGTELLKSILTDKTAEISKELVKNFENPALREVVVNALRTMGQQSGNALFVEIADAMQKTEKTIKSFSDKAKSLLSDTFKVFDELGTGVGNILMETENFVGMVMESAGQSLIQIVDKTTGAIVATGTEAARMMGSSIGDILRENQTLARTTGGMVAGEFNTAAQKLQEAAQKSKAAAELAGSAIEQRLAKPMDVFAGKSVKLVDDGMGNLKMRVVDTATAGGTAITTKMIAPLDQTTAAAQTTTGAFTVLAQETVKTAAEFQNAIAGVDQMITTIGERMITVLTATADALKVVFEKLGFDAGKSMMDSLQRQITAAVPTLSAAASYAGMNMGYAMGRALEMAMQTSIQNINKAIDAMARRAAAAAAAAMSAARTNTGVSAAALDAAYAREG